MNRWAAAAVVLSALAGEAMAFTHEPKGMIGTHKETRGKLVSCFCLDGDGNIVAADEEGQCLRVIAPDDTLKALWKLDFAPQAVAWRASDKTLLVAGSGRIAALGPDGKVVRAAALPSAGVQGTAKAKSDDKKAEASSVTASGEDVFVTVRASTGFTVYRLDSKLENPKAILTGLRGCCRQMDVMASGDTLYVAANCAFEVTLYDREGKKKGAITKPKGAKYFDGCCEPKNVCMGPDGSLYVAESAKCAVNRFSTDGKFLGEVGCVPDIGGCVRVTLAVSADGARVYMLDTNKNVVRVLERKK